MIGKKISKQDITQFLDRIVFFDLSKRKIFLWILLIGISVFFILQNYPNISIWDNDSPSFYTAAKGMTQNINIYEEKNFQETADSIFGKSHVIFPYLYFPVVAQLFVPFTLLDFQTYFSVIFFINILLTFFSLYLVYDLLDLKSQKSSLPVIFLFLLIYGNVPLFNTIHHGQINLMVFVFILLALKFLKKEKVYLASFFLCIAVFFKIWPVLFLIFFLLQKRFRLVIYAAVNSTAVLLISVLLFSPRPWLEFFGRASHNFSYGEKGSFFLDFGAHINNYSLNGLLSQIFLKLNISRSFVTPAVLILLFMVLLLLRKQVVALIRSEDTNLNAVIILSISLILSTISWSHHYVIMIFPLAYFFNRIILEKRYIYFLPWFAAAYFLLYYPTWGGFPFNQFRLLSLILFLCMLLFFHFVNRSEFKTQER